MKLSKVLMVFSLFVISACGKDEEKTTQAATVPAPTRPTLSKDDYTKLQQTDTETLFRKAKVQELGACRAVNLGYEKYLCYPGGTAYTVKLADLNVYYPSMRAEVGHDVECDSVGQNLKKALNDGFCFTVSGN